VFEATRITSTIEFTSGDDYQVVMHDPAAKVKAVQRASLAMSPAFSSADLIRYTAKRHGPGLHDGRIRMVRA
jgi:hypothetical protein